MLAAATAPIGGHLWHVVMLLAWTPIFAAIFLFERIAARRRAWRRRIAGDGGYAGIPACPGKASVRRSGSSWLQVTALASFGAALVHVAVMPDHFRESVMYGLFFLGASVGQSAFGVLILARPSRHLVMAGIIGSALLILLWMVSRTWGVPIGPDNGATESFGVLDALATSYEAVTVIFGLLAIRYWIPVPAWRWSKWAPVLRLVAPLCIVGTLIASVLSVRS
jgi:hypothetical protein